MSSDTKSFINLSTGETLCQAREENRDDLYRICLSTGGSSDEQKKRERFKKMLGEVYVGPHLTFSPQFSYVLRDINIVGYIVAVLDTADFEKTLESNWWPHLVSEYSNQSLNESERELFTLMAEPVRTPSELLEKFPSHLHINLMDAYQGKGRGVEMMDFTLSNLKESGSNGIHLRMNSRNERAYHFYTKLGFSIYSKSQNEWILVKEL
jgi:ribosomal protein S18 acetylase RimI-like enzyme